jgi:hypothetical protein
VGVAAGNPTTASRPSATAAATRARHRGTKEKEGRSALNAVDESPRARRHREGVGVMRQRRGKHAIAAGRRI